VPTYNERQNLQELVSRIDSSCQTANIEAEILIVDDNSPDGTGSYAEELGKRYRIEVIHRSGKLGLSSAVLEGFERATGSILVVMDADLSHPPEKIPELVERIVDGDADMTIGSRHIRGGSIENWSFYRRIVSKGATLLARGLTKVKDPMSGFFAIRRSVIDGVKLNPVGYKIGLEILVKGNISNVVEVPITFANRKSGKSKLGGSVYLTYIDHLIMLYEHKRLWLAKYLKFAFIGGIGAVINILIFWTAIEIFFVNYLWAAVLSFSIAVTINFFLNRYWTFRSKGRIPIQYIQFMLVSIDGLMLNLIILHEIVENVLPTLGISEDRASVVITVSNLMVILLVSIFNFFANSIWTFSEDMNRKS